MTRMTNNTANATKRKKPHDRILLRLLQSLDLSRLPQHPAAGERAWRRDFVAADFGRRNLQHHQPERLRLARHAGASEGALHEEGYCRLGALGGACNQDAAEGVSGE